MPTLEETQATDKVRFLNDLALTRVLQDHPAILIRPADMKNWRPCRTSCVGILEGLEHLGTLVPLCTDGCVAWFLGRSPIVHREAVAGAPRGPFPESFVLFGHVAGFAWGENRGAPPQPHSLPPPATKDHVITPFQSQKDGKWWFVRKDGKWVGPLESQEAAQGVIDTLAKGGRQESRPRVPSALDAALDLLKTLK